MKLTKSETNNCIVTTLTTVMPHPNADRLQLATVLGTQVIVGLDAFAGDEVLYFDSNLRLSHDYLRANNLFSNPEQNADGVTRGYFPKSGRVKAQKLRGEMSNGYVAPITSLLPVRDVAAELTSGLFKVGTEFTHIDDVLICAKYIIPKKQSNVQGKGRKGYRIKTNMFHKHWDTKQLMRNLDELVPGPIFVEEKIHGTSGRTARARFKKPWYRRLFCSNSHEYRTVSGTRRMDHINYHMPQVRKEIEARIWPYLRKGEEVYYEIFGNDSGGKAIQDGFTYGCRGGEYRAILYRVTFTNEDGYCIDMDRHYVYGRAEQLGLEKPTVLLSTCIFPIDDDEFKYTWLPNTIMDLAGGQSSLDKDTMREGVVVWFQNASGLWTCLKFKGEKFLAKISKQLDKDIVDVEDSL